MQHITFWMPLSGVLVLAAIAANTTNTYTQQCRTKFYQFMSYECSKLFNYNLSGICHASIQMSPSQYATATSRIEERIQKPLLLIEGLRAELAGKEELEAKLQSAEVLNTELVKAAAVQVSQHVLKEDTAAQTIKRLRGNQNMQIVQLEAQMRNEAIHYKAVTSDYNRVKLPASVTALDEVPPELERFAALDMNTGGLKLSIPYLASQLYNMEVPTHASEWAVLQTSMCTQIKPRLQNAFLGWNGKNLRWPKNWKNQSVSEEEVDGEDVAPRTERPREFLCMFSALAAPFKDLWECLSLQKDVCNPIREEDAEACESDADEEVSLNTLESARKKQKKG